MKPLSQRRFTSTCIDLNKLFDDVYEQPINFLTLRPGEDFNAALEKCETALPKQFEEDINQ
jgi:hypothetical protein